MDGDRLILGSDRTAVSDGSHPAWAILIVHEGLGFGRQVRPTGYKVMPRFAPRRNDRSPGSYSRTPACDRRETVCIGAPIRTSLAGAVRQRPGRCAPAPPVAPPRPAPQEAVRSGRGNGRLRSNQVYNPGLHSTDTVRAACIQAGLRIAWGSSVPSSPAPGAHRCAAAGLDRPYSPSPGLPCRMQRLADKVRRASLHPTPSNRSNPNLHMRSRTVQDPTRSDTVRHIRS
jgi:hypothetical protein